MCGLVDQWISGSVDWWIGGSVDQWIGGSVEGGREEGERNGNVQKVGHVKSGHISYRLTD